MMVPGTGVAAMVAAPQAAVGGASADWKADIERRRAALIAKNGPGTDAAERDESV